MIPIELLSKIITYFENNVKVSFLYAAAHLCSTGVCLEKDGVLAGK